MVNSNNICTCFINYFSFLILLCFSSLSFAGQFGGGGASGEWDEPNNCPPANDLYSPATWGAGVWYDSPSAACNGSLAALKKGTTKYDSSTVTVVGTSCHFNINGDTANHKYPLQTKPNPSYDPNCELKCPAGYEKDANGKCQPKKCPVGQTLVNGQCKQKQCPAGQALDKNGQCFAPDDQCPAGQKMVNGRCITPPPDDPDDPDDPNSEWPPFCEWASVMCQWHEEWQQWSNDYAANEQKANLDREELKRIGLDSKENLDEMNQKMTDQLQKLDEQKQKLEELKIPLNEIKQQDQQFYDEVRLWLNNFDSTNGNPSEQNPSIEFPPFCDWSVQVCNWYLDWKDWRTDYNAHNALVIEKYNQYLQRLDEIKQQDKQFYDDFESYASAVTLNQEKDFEQNKDFYDEIRDFFDWYKDQSEQNPNDPNDPSNPENQDGDVSVGQQEIPFNDSQRITFINGCPAGEQFTVSFMGSTQNLEFSYQPLCQFMTMIRPFVIAIAYLIGAYILMGLSRGSSE